MVFSSLVFLYAFLPAVLLCYFLCPARYRIGVLLAFSLLFYGWGEPLYLLLMLASILLNFFMGGAVGRVKQSAPGRARLLVGVCVGVNLAALCFFKYADFFAENVGLRPLGVALPLGISFYTFQSMSYAVDVYRGDAPVQKSWAKFATYVSFFPQLIAGPIVRYKTIADQLESRTENAERFHGGIVLFLVGLSKKVLLANSFGQLYDLFTAAAPAQRSVIGAWFGILAYTMQIYFDFGGYSDMAIGLGRLFGFEFLPNFKYPYLSKSVGEFWRERWHISLGTWFREYLYIPLGGNRKGRLRTVGNLAIVWLLTGFWHGASWNFVLWGAYYGALIIAERLFLGKWLARIPAVFARLYTLFFVTIGWVIFSQTDFSAMTAYLGSLFNAYGAGLINDAARYALAGWTPLFLTGVLACTPLGANLAGRLRAARPRLYAVAEAALCVLALLLCTAYIVDASYNPFLYFRF